MKIYIIKKIEQSGDGTIVTDTPSLKNTYNTPGIKTIKIVVFSYDESTNQVGRWKLIKSRFFLDIPRSEFPDFGELGGEDYNVIPWPTTTVVIGGVDNKSNYKTSVQKAISSGNIGDSDIIDEKFLIQDFENDELGKSINKLDLEQVRFFNKNYSINSLLRIENNPFYTYDSSGNSNKGLLIGDYKVKKDRKGQSMRRDSFIKVPKKTSNKNGAL